MMEFNKRKQYYLDKAIAFCKSTYGLDEQFIKMLISDGLDLYDGIAKEKNMSRDIVKRDMFAVMYGKDLGQQRLNKLRGV